MHTSHDKYVQWNVDTHINFLLPYIRTYVCTCTYVCAGKEKLSCCLKVVVMRSHCIISCVSIALHVIYM